MLNKKKIPAFYIQEILVSYRKPLIDMLSNEYELTIFSDKPNSGSGFKAINASKANLVDAKCIYFLNKKFFFQKKIIKNIIHKRPAIVLTSASTRNMTYWTMLFLCKFLGIKVFSHGHGLYSKPKPGFFVKLLYKLISLMTYKYISYTNVSRDVLMKIGFNPEKILVAENSISLTVDTSYLNKSGEENGILYIGRLRKNCELDNLIAAVALLRQNDKDIFLHIIGSGEKEEYFRRKYSLDWIFFYGQIYDDNEIIEISKKCKYGCYPGNVGLSVVHYFSLKLPCLIHGNITEHGPEASYVINNLNGFIFNKTGKKKSINDVLYHAWNLPRKEYIKLSNRAFYEYQRLNSPALEERILYILNSQ